VISVEKWDKVGLMLMQQAILVVTVHPVTRVGWSIQMFFA
jgi:hypothetical protein